MSSDICEFSYENLTMQISISLKQDLIKRIDEAAGVQSRSAFIVSCIHEHFNPSLDADKKQLLSQIEVNKVQQLRLDAEIAYLREQNARLTDAISQKLLTESTPRRSIWDRIRGRKQ